MAKTEGKRNLIQQLLEEYDIQTAEDIQNALKDLLGGTIKEMMETEMDDHLGYEKFQLLIVMITEMATNPNVSTAVTEVWIFKFPRIVSHHLNHRL